MEAERFLKAFRARVAKFGLELHPEKTRLIEFGRFAAQNREKRGEGKPETFTVLGFTHYCGKRRSNGSFIVWRKTAKKRMVAKLQAIKAELRLRMHEPVADVGAWLRKAVNGYYRYHAVPGNIDRLSVFGQRLRRLWWLILRRRSQGPVPWDRVTPISSRWIPAPRVLHPYPIARFLSTHPRWEPYACLGANLLRYFGVIEVRTRPLDSPVGTPGHEQICCARPMADLSQIVSGQVRSAHARRSHGDDLHCDHLVGPDGVCWGVRVSIAPRIHTLSSRRASNHC